MGFIYGEECLGGLVGAHVTAVPTHTVLSKHLSMSMSSLSAPWSLARMKLKGLQDAFTNDLTCFFQLKWKAEARFGYNSNYPWHGGWQGLTAWWTANPSSCSLFLSCSAGCAAVSLPLHCLDPCSRSVARKVVALLIPLWQTVLGACLAGVCLLMKLGIGLPGRLTLPTNTELDEAICTA